MTGFGGEVAGKVQFIHQKSGFHGKVMGEMLFVHQNGSFDGETGLQERVSGTKQGGMEKRCCWDDYLHIKNVTKYVFRKKNVTS